MEVRDGERFVPDEAWRICSTHRAGSLVEASIIAYPSSATSVLHKLFDFAKRRAVELHWDHETRFARNLRQLLIDDPSMESVWEEVLAIDASFSPHSYNGSIAVWWMTSFCCAQWTMRIVY